MPKIIPPELDPGRFQYLDPLVFGEFDSSGNIGWNRATSIIISYYLQQRPFDSTILSPGDLDEDIVDTWKINLEDSTVENTAENLAALVLQVLVTITGEEIPGVSPPKPPEEPPTERPIIVDPVLPETPQAGEPFPPVVSPRPPSTGLPRQPTSELPEGAQPIEEPIAPPRQPRQPQQPISPPREPVVPLPAFPSLPRQPEPQVPRSPDQGTGEGSEEEPSREEPPEEETVPPGDEETVPPVAGLEIDYQALETAIYRALARFYDLILANPFETKVSTDPPPDVPAADLIQEIQRQVEIFNDAGKIISSDNADPEGSLPPNIFTLPGKQ